MRKYPGLLITLASAFICTACFDPTFALRWNEEFSKQRIVIRPWVGELEGKGFDIYMRPDDAERVKAPNSSEFQKLLDEKITQEKHSGGHLLCQLGYKLGSTVNYYHGVYALIAAECKR